MEAAVKQISLGEHLLREGMINKAQLDSALAIQAETMRSIGRILVDMKLITESSRMTILRKQFGFEAIGLKNMRVDAGILKAVPYSFAEKHRVVPLRVENDALLVAMEDPSDILVVDAIKNQVGLRVKPHVASSADIQGVLKQYLTGDEAEPVITSSPRRKGSAAARLAHTGAFWLLAIAPLIVFFLAVKFDIGDLEYTLSLQKDRGNLSDFDLMLYVGLLWSLWTVVIYWLDGVLFGDASMHA